MILIVGAMSEEIEQIAQQVQDGQLAGKAVHVEAVGVGKVMSAMTTQRLIDQLQPDFVLMVGVAGALNPALSIGDIVLAERTIQHDLDTTALGIPRGTVPFTSWRWLEADPEWLQKARDLLQCHCGIILTGDQFMSRSAQQQNAYLRAELHGDAVDMESAAVAQVCACNSIPHLVIRMISDTADGSAKVDFWRFMPQAGKRLAEIVVDLIQA
jgi:5'-methylthioadenosine/S-adenosylhomocysteine nucleosidase